MGILAAVAIPKFFDLQARARQKAIYTALSEMKVRINQRFASALLDGVAVGSVLYAESAVGTNLGGDFFIANWNWASGSTQISFDLTYYPNPDNTGLNPVTTNAVLALPETGL
jgi:type II secretory pathway pseudopilin PulG